NYLLANRIRKYGRPHDAKEFTAQMIDRVRKFGFNSTGAFGSGNVAALKEKKFPWIAGINLVPWKGVPFIARQVWDPFDKKTRAAVEKNLSALAANADDPLLIGYFLTNEPLFEDIPKLVASFGGNKASKQKLVRMLEKKYKTIEAFNTAWGTDIDSFDTARREGLPIKTKAASADLEEFKKIFFEEYFSFMTGLIRKYDPNHLILGCRLQAGTINDETLNRIAAKYVDVWSFNYYTYGIDEDFLKKIYEWTDKPMILSEFYWNSYTDSGVSGGVKDVSSQQERGLAYRNYVEHAASLPFVIGVEWFTLLDAAQTGVGFAKYNGENPNSGLINIVDRPYKTMIAEMIKTNYRIYDVASGKKERFVYKDPKFQSGGKRSNSVVASRVPRGSMKIDGEITGWPGMPAERIGSDRLVQGSNADGLSAAFRLAWDEDFLYLLVDVTDSTPMQNEQSNADLWKGDGIEIFIGSEELEKGGPLRFSDRHILLSAAPDAATPAFYLNTETQPETKTAIIPKAGGNGYVLEAALPWEALGGKPEPDKSYRFDVAIDDSANGKKRRGHLVWNGTEFNSGDRTPLGPHATDRTGRLNHLFFDLQQCQHAPCFSLFHAVGVIFF
ncbi:MAG: sugar-binding protein, partial [Chthoniobacterales bacterium]